MKFVKTTVITLLFFVAIWVYSKVFLDVSARQQQLFINHFLSNVNKIEEWYLELEDLEPAHKEILEMIPQELKVLDTKAFLAELNKSKDLKNKYFGKIIETIKISDCSVDEFVEVELNGKTELADRYKLIINEKTLVTQITTIAKEALQDEEFIKLCEKFFSKQQIKDLKTLNEQYIKNIDNIQESAQTKINIYMKNGKTVRADLITSNWQISYEVRNLEGKDVIAFSVK